MKIVTHLTLLLTLAACGQAKTIYADQKYDLCKEKCNLKYSKYNTTEKNQCLSKCSRSKYEDVK
ncbi:MAG: hypothetical protein KC493_03870 [Bacteriovoracaceae bacterium]|nr:hypothetical protein [Bacteriovoracaceae bacterium]